MYSLSSFDVRTPNYNFKLSFWTSCQTAQIFFVCILLGSESRNVPSTLQDSWEAPISVI